MFLNKFDIHSNQTHAIGGVPSGLEPLLVAELACDHANGPVIYVTSDDSHMASAAEALAFFAPAVSVFGFPAWDCLPYDRVSPRADILGERVQTLTRLAATPILEPSVLLTTINSFIQRVPVADQFQESGFHIAERSRLDTDRLIAFLERNGFNRAGTVREAGEYAIRGGIFDIFPASHPNPVRVDLFGDEVESLREFDALSQKSIRKLAEFGLNAVSELIIEQDSIERFRTGYRGLFGDVADDPLYEAVSAGHRIAGAEHWLPLFAKGMAKISDYLPDAPILLQDQFAPALDARMEAITDFFDARMSWLDSQKTGEKDSGNSIYRPLPPDRLYLSGAEIEDMLRKRKIVQFSPFSAPESTATGHVDLGGRRMVRFSDPDSADTARTTENNFDKAVGSIKKLLDSKTRVFVSAYSAGSRERLSVLFEDHGLRNRFHADSWEDAIKGPGDQVGFITLGLAEGFICNRFAILTEQDVLGERLIRQTSRRKRGEAFLADISELSAGDVVVHVEHGLGRYEGLETIEAAGAPHDCLRVIYDGGDRLYVPVENIELLSRFGSGDSAVSLDRLGGAAWQARKSKLKERLREIAEELIKTAAARTLRPGRKLSIDDHVYAEFSARFPFQETDDQLSAISDTLEDLHSGRPMDRLICGDVGFGKTEVALRATFSAVMAGGQVAVIAPTTLLVRQHFASFTERFRGYPVEVRQLSRLVSAKDAAATREGLAGGAVDIVVGTHALLSKNVGFHDLALLIVDEEQHFGVNHKERLKQLRTDVHVLTLSATPIPRTLQMALSGVKDMSIIATPPVDRLAVRTFVMPSDPVTLREAIMRERFRGGQIFYVCPRISDLDPVAEELRELVPGVRIAMAHGQMPVSQLEEVMNAFYDGRVDLLLSTQIVESGLDIPNANTLIIHRADMFGLAQLYQLRGRIGRSKVRAYCYLTLPPKTPLGETATKRLEVMQSLDSLGAGFTLASHDLDIRGAGNLLGDEQSGHIREVGVELYQQMLEEAVAAARSGEDAGTVGDDGWSPTISLGTAVLIPESFVPDLNARLSLYRRASSLETSSEIDSFSAELVDRFGQLPHEVESLLQIIAIKQLCKKAGIEKMEAGPKGAVLKFHNDRFEPLDRLIGFIQQEPRNITLRPDHQLVVRRDWGRADTRLKGARKLAKTLSDMVD